MEKYEYLEQVTSDVKDYIVENIDLDNYEDCEELSDYLNDALWIEDSVTGNASGSYYCNAWRAEEALTHNWDLLEEALEEFGEGNLNAISKGAEWCDVTIRCYLLGRAISDALEELEIEEYYNKEELDD